MQAIVQIFKPLAGPKVGEAVRKTVNEIFGVFAQSMAAAFQKFMRPDGTFPPRLGEQLHKCPTVPAVGSVAALTPMSEVCAPRYLAGFLSNRG